MPNYARIVRNTAIEVCTNPNELYHPLLAKEFVEVPQEVENGWILSESGQWYPKPLTQGPTAEQIKNMISEAIQKRLDDFAKTKGYDSILSACSYIFSNNAVFRAEAELCSNLRDQTWQKATEIMNEVIAGTRNVPTSIKDIEEELPKLVWVD